MRNSWDTGGLLAFNFMAFLGDVNELDPMTPRAQLIGELRRAYYAGAALVIAVVDQAPSNEIACDALLTMKAEAHAMADVINTANDSSDGTPAA